MKKLRIALWNNLPSGGGKRAFFEMASGLVGKGHHLESWCPPTAHRSYLPLEGMMRENVVAYDIPSFKQNRFLARIGVADRSIQNKFAAMDRHCRECAGGINAGGFDVLLATNCWDFAVPPIGRHVRIPKVIYHGEPRRHLYEARPKLPWVARPAAENGFWPLPKLRRQIVDHSSIVLKRIELREELDSVSAFDLILVNSAFSRETMLRSYGLDSRVCYLGINTQLFKSTGTAREGYVVGLGGFQRHKGIDTAIAALATIPSPERPKLLWIGNLLDDSYRNEMIALSKNLEVNLECRQLVSDEELVDCLNRAALMIYTSRLEPFGFAPLEANACGTPVVAVAEGGVRETVQHEVNGLLVPDRDAKALGAAVQRLLKDCSLARQLGETGLKLVREVWNWESSMERLEESLFEVIAVKNQVSPTKS
jgi:glycosyltransferase involved in cell wall biosynthesis